MLGLLSQCAEDSDDGVRTIAYRRLGEMHLDAAPVLPLIEKGLRDASPGVRSSACNVAANYGKAASSLLTLLNRLVTDDEDETVRSMAKDAVERIGRDANHEDPAASTTQAK